MQLKKMNYINLTCNNIDKLRKQSNFKLAVQLSRMQNTILASQRQYLRIDVDNDPANKRDRFELLLYHSAVIFESIKTLLSYSSQLKKLDSWKIQNIAVQKIQQEFNNDKSFTQKYLEPIRNKILFHYDTGVIEEILRNYTLTEKTIFAEAKSEMTFDLVFTLTDELLINFLMQSIEEKNTESEKWRYFLEKLLEISNILSGLLYDFIIELLGEHLSIEKDKDN
jgi:hypothetical protein